MSKTSRKYDLQAIRNLLSQAEGILTGDSLRLGAALRVGARLPEAKVENAVELLRTALSLTDGLIYHSDNVERWEGRRQVTESLTSKAHC